MGEPCPELFGFGAVENAYVLTAETQHQFGFGCASRVEGRVGQVFAVDDAIANLEEFHKIFGLVGLRVFIDSSAILHG